MAAADAPSWKGLDIQAKPVLPKGPAIRHCMPAVDGGLSVSWEASPGADYYEVQLASEKDGQPFAVYATGREGALLRDLLPGTTYWFRVRAHATGSPSLGPGSWGPTGTSLACTTPETFAASPARSPVKAAGETFELEVLRESEYTYDVDYLMNHNSGSVLGDAAFLTFTGRDPKKPNFFNVTFSNATLTLFCVDVLKVRVPDTTTTGGDDAYADYASCNDNNNPYAPLCECDNWIDRVIAEQDPNKDCHTESGQPCSAESWHQNCTCACTEKSLQQSATFVGMMPVRLHSPIQLGSWYSHPAATECREEEQVGAHRADGSRCTWKRRPMARVVRGWQVLHHGWNTTITPFLAPINPLQVLENAASIRSAFAAAPLATWHCGGAAASTNSIVDEEVATVPSFTV